jgi:hypothetical protein
VRRSRRRLFCQVLEYNRKRGEINREGKIVGRNWIFETSHPLKSIKCKG